jgi:hypothetical protein
MELFGLKWMLERLNELVGEDRERNEDASRDQHRDEERDYAITSLRRALNETEIYYGSWREANQRDRQKEEELSRMWIEVARELRSVDRELSKRCEIKARYWADPVGWPAEGLMDLQITLQQMHDALDRLLGDDEEET